MKIELDKKQYKLIKIQLEKDLEELRYGIKREFQDLKKGISKGDFDLAITSCENLIELLSEAKAKENFLEQLEEMVVEE